jgi:hypothetical protein
MLYPRKPNHKDHYTSDDWKIHGNLSALRSMRIQMLADAMEGRSNGERLAARAKRRIVRSKVVFQDQYNYLWKLAKKEEWDKLMDECTSLITEMEEHLSTKSRHERAHQMRKNLKVRKERFADPDKKMLKLVINSIMQRYQAPHHLTSVESEGDMKYS